MTTKKQITIQKSKKQIGQNKNKATHFQSLNSQKLTATLVSTCYKKEQSTPILWASTRSDYNGFVIRKKSDSLPLQTSLAVKLSQPASLLKSFQPSSAIKLHRKQDIQKNKLKPPLNNNQNHVASNNNQNQVASNKNQNQVASNNIQNQVASNVKLTDSFSNYFDSSRVNIFADRKECLNHNSAFTKDCSNSGFMISSKKYDTSRSSKDLKSDQDIPNHSCPKCCTLMWKKENEPYIMVPCGHSICLSCLSEQNHCVICNCQIIGSEQNKILLSVINKFQSFKIKLKLEEKEKEARYYIAQFQSIDKEIKVVQVCNISSLIGPHKSVKCIQQNRNYVFTTDALLYFNAIDNKHWTHHVISERCVCFIEKNHNGSELFLFYVGAWCQCFIELLDKGLSGELIMQGCMNMLSLAIKSFRKSFVYGFNTVSNIETITKKIVFNTFQGCYNKIETEHFYLNHTTPDINKTLEKSCFLPTNLSKPVLNKSKHVFNKYSRYSTITQDFCSDKNKLILDRFCRLCCFSANETVLDLISALYSTHFNNSAVDSSCNEELFDLDSKCVLTETCVSTSKSKIIDGILVPVSSNILLLQDFQRGIKNVVLLNTISYGVELPYIDDVKIIENIAYNEYILPNSSIHEHIINTLLQLNINVIIYRGDLDATTISELNRIGIVNIKIKSYPRLFCLSKLLAVSICYDFNDLSLNNIGHVEVSRISLLPESVIYTDVADNTGVYLKISSNHFKYYTVLLCGRTFDLLNLLADEFNSCFHRIQNVFKNKLVLLGHAENEIISTLKDNKICTKRLSHDHCITKCHHSLNERELFFHFDLLKEHVLKVFLSYLQLFDRTDITHYLVEDFHFRVALWEDSLKCASLLMKTNVVEVNF